MVDAENRNPIFSENLLCMYFYDFSHLAEGKLNRKKYGRIAWMLTFLLVPFLTSLLKNKSLVQFGEEYLFCSSRYYGRSLNRITTLEKRSNRLVDRFLF